MKWRWILLLALMLSVGVNLGTLIAVWRRAPATPTVAAAAVQAAPAQAVTVQPAAEAPRATTTAPAEEIVVTPKRGPAPAQARGRTIPPQPDPAPASPPPPTPAPPTPREIAAPAEEARPDPLPAPGEPALALADEPVDPVDPVDPARPDRPVGPRVGVPPPAFDRLAAELGLSADQSARFFAAQRLHVQSGRALQGRLQRSRIELARLLSGESVDRATIDGLLREQAELQAALDRELATMLVEARGMLTPQQYRRYARMVLTRLIATGPGGPREAGPPPGPQRRPGSRRPRRFD